MTNKDTKKVKFIDLRDIAIIALFITGIVYFAPFEGNFLFDALIGTAKEEMVSIWESVAK